MDRLTWTLAQVAISLRHSFSPTESLVSRPDVCNDPHSNALAGLPTRKVRSRSPRTSTPRQGLQGVKGSAPDGAEEQDQRDGRSPADRAADSRETVLHQYIGGALRTGSSGVVHAVT